VFLGVGVAGGGGGGVRERGVLEDFENMDCEIRHFSDFQHFRLRKEEVATSLTLPLDPPLKMQNVSNQIKAPEQCLQVLLYIL